MKQINCTVVGHATDTPYLTIDNGHMFHGEFESPSRVLFFVPDEEPPWGATFFYGGKTLRYVIPEAPGAYEGPALEYSYPLARLEPRGPHFYVNGVKWTWAMMTGFLDYYLYLVGAHAQLRAALQQAKDLGSNGRRVLGMAHYITRFDPRAFGPAYYNEFAGFVQFEAEYNQRIHFDVFADNQIYNLGEQHWAQINDAARPHESVIVGAGNEWSKNGFDPFRLAYPGVLSSQGSAVADTAPPMPGWGVRMWHGRRDYPKVFMSSDDMVYVERGLHANGHQYAPVAPTVHDEPMGFAEIDIPGRRSTDPRLAEALMLTGRAHGAGATFHSEDGIFSRPLGPQQVVCALAFFGAAR